MPLTYEKIPRVRQIIEAAFTRTINSTDEINERRQFIVDCFNLLMDRDTNLGPDDEIKCYVQEPVCQFPSLKTLTERELHVMSYLNKLALFCALYTHSKDSENADDFVELAKVDINWISTAWTEVQTAWQKIENNHDLEDNKDLQHFCEIQLKQYQNNIEAEKNLRNNRIALARRFEKTKIGYYVLMVCLIGAVAITEDIGIQRKIFWFSGFLVFTRMFVVIATPISLMPSFFREHYYKYKYTELTSTKLPILKPENFPGMKHIVDSLSLPSTQGYIQSDEDVQQQDHLKMT